MKLQFRTNYDDCSDKELVDKIIKPPHNEEAAAYLLYNRYDPLLKSVYQNMAKSFFWFDDCVSELFINLKGKGSDWHALSTFEWRSSLGYWLKGVAWNDFKSTLKKVAPPTVILLSIDEEDEKGNTMQLPDGGEKEYERIQRKIALLEAIGQLENANQKFVVLKRLQGYNSREIADLLKKRWKKYGIEIYNGRNELVIPTATYVDSCMQHAKAVLKETIVL
jgi:RNA polymerase sigma factor (sigma-70 family)